MKILYLAHRVPWPPVKGDRLRSWRWMMALSERHDVWLGALAETEAGLQVPPELEGRLAGVAVFRRPSRIRAARALASGRSLSEEVFRSRPLLRWTEQIASVIPFDAALGFSSTTAQYLEGVPCPRVLDLVDADSAKFSRYATSLRWRTLWRLEAERLRRLEALIVGTFDHVLTVSAAEAARLPTGPAGVEVLPNGVNAGLFRPASGRAERPGTSVLFTGAMDYPPNVDAVRWFATRIWPRIREEVPRATFTIAGSSPARSVRALRGSPGVKVTGTVPDVRPYLEAADVAVAPLRIALGVQNKVLEALAAGLPVVATPGAAEGIEAEAGRHLLVESEPESLARAVIDLLGDPGRRAALGRAGRAFVREKHRWEPVMRRMAEVLGEVARCRRSPSLERATGVGT